MTVLVTESSKTYVGNGVTFAFPVPFRFIENAHLTVKKTHAGVTTTLVEGLDYSVAGADTQAGGIVVCGTPPAIGDTLYIERNTPILQETDLRPSGPFTSDDIEEMFDRRCMVEQELARRLTAAEAAIVAGVDLAALNSVIVTKDFLTDANAVENTFPLVVNAAGGDTAQLVLIGYLENRDDPSEVFDEKPAIQWARGGEGSGTISVLGVDGLKPGTNYRMRLWVIQ